MVLLALLEKCVHHTTYWCFLHTHAVVLAHQIWCASTVPPSTPMQFGVYNTPQVLCPEWQIVKWSAQPIWCVLYTRCRNVNTIHQSVLQTLQWILCTPGIYTKYTHKACSIQLCDTNQWEGMHILCIYSQMQSMKTLSLSPLLWVFVVTCTNDMQPLDEWWLMHTWL